MLDAEQRQEQAGAVRVAGQRVVVELHGGFLWSEVTGTSRSLDAKSRDAASAAESRARSIDTSRNENGGCAPENSGVGRWSLGVGAALLAEMRQLVRMYLVSASQQSGE
jgi:hypothetical protein